LFNEIIRIFIPQNIPHYIGASTWLRTRSWQINILPKWLRLRAAVAAPLALASKDLREPAALRVDQLHQNSGPSGQRRHHQDAQHSSRLGRRVGGAAINVIGCGERVDIPLFSSLPVNDMVRSPVPPDEWVVDGDVELLEPQPQTLSPMGRVRFSIGGKIWSGKANALRLIVEANGRI
jgi:hypothetical protein